MRSALRGLEELLDGDARGEDVRRYLAHVDTAIERSDFDEQDRTAARQEDPQGLGLTR